MKTRQQAVDYGLTFKDTYMETPFRDTNWQLIRVKGSKKHFFGFMKGTALLILM